MNDEKSAQVCDHIRRQCGGRVTVALFRDQPWRSKAEAFESVGLCADLKMKWFEIRRDDAMDLAASVLAEDLCYGSRIMSLEGAQRLVLPFFELMHGQTRYFTNSEVPYHRRSPNAWLFTSISRDTVDTGIACELAKNLTGILWVCDRD